MDVAGFILRHGLLGDQNFKLNENPVDYMEFTMHYQKCCASKIFDADILMTCLLNMLGRKATQAVKLWLPPVAKFCTLPKILEVLKTKFGLPQRI